MHDDHGESYAKPRRGLSNPDPVIRRCRKQLDQAEKYARRILRAARFDVEKLEAEDIAYTHKRRTQVRWHPPVSLDLNMDAGIRRRLEEPTDPVSYAFGMLRYVRLMREMMDDPHLTSAELLPLIYCFNLGIQFRRAELGLVFPETEASFLTRRQKRAASVERTHPLRPLVEGIYSQLEAAGKKRDWKSVRRELLKSLKGDESIPDGTLRNWLTQIRRKKNSR